MSIVNKFRNWCYRQALKDKNILASRELFVDNECIGYNNWVQSLHKEGFPKNENGSMMDCWQLYHHYKSLSGKRKIYIEHAERYNN